MRARVLLACLLAGVGGCSGHYVFSVPDQLAPAGGEATTVLRLQRNEFAGVLLPVKNQPVQLRANGGALRGAFTDSLGYAGAALPAPKQPGVYEVSISLQDRRGDEAAAVAPLYVLAADKPVLAVDAACLPHEPSPEVKQALKAAAADGGVIYFTDQPRKRLALRESLRAGGYPDGPLVWWQSQAWHVVRQGPLPRIVVESRLVSPLDHLRASFPGLTCGLTADPAAARAFAGAGMKVVYIGAPPPGVANVAARANWAELAAVGL